MKVVLQRVSEASVTVDDQPVAAIGLGLLLLVGFARGDGEAELEWMTEKVLHLRIFGDTEGQMNRSLQELGGELLVVSQFTLYGDVRKGHRPSFAHAADSSLARVQYDRFVGMLRAQSVGRVEDGEFGSMMQVSLVNEGPVTLVIERARTDQADR